MIVGKVRDNQIQADEAFSSWKAFVGAEFDKCSVEGCSSKPTTSLQVKVYGSSEVFIVPACNDCCNSKSILTDLKEDSILVPLEIQESMAS